MAEPFRPKPWIPEPRIPVTVIGGYLGAGKTTLVNHILRSAASGETGERVAVLVNDFGDINIDAALIAPAQDEGHANMLSLTNGCICCSLVDGLSAAFDALLALAPRPDRIVIEASGVADPAGVAAFAHGPGLQLDATVVVVDNESITTTLEDSYVGTTARGQLNAADIIVANKADLAPVPEAIEQLPALVVPATNAAIAPELLFGQIARPRSGTPSASSEEPAFESWTVQRSRPTAPRVIERYLHALPPRVVRAKGIVWSAERPDRQLIVHRVGQRVRTHVGPAWPDAPHTTIVVIAVRGTSWVAHRGWRDARQDRA